MNKFIAIPVLLLSSLFIIVSFQNCGKIQTQDLLANQNQALTADGIDTVELPLGPTLINQPGGMGSPNNGSMGSTTNNPNGSNATSTNPAAGGSSNTNTTNGNANPAGPSGDVSPIVVKDPSIELPPVCEAVQSHDHSEGEDREEEDHDRDSEHGHEHHGDHSPERKLAGHQLSKAKVADLENSEENENEKKEHDQSVALCEGNTEDHHGHGKNKDDDEDDDSDDSDHELKEARMHCNLARSKFGRKVLKSLKNVRVIEVSEEIEIDQLQGVSILLGSKSGAKVKSIKSAKGLKIFCDIVVEKIDESKGRMILINSEVLQTESANGRVDLVNSRIQDISKSSCQVHKHDR